MRRCLHVTLTTGYPVAARPAPNATNTVFWADTCLSTNMQVRATTHVFKSTQLGQLLINPLHYAVCTVDGAVDKWLYTMKIGRYQLYALIQGYTA